jgi:hypothetical protein
MAQAQKYGKSRCLRLSSECKEDWLKLRSVCSRRQFPYGNTYLFGVPLLEATPLFAHELCNLNFNELVTVHKMCNFGE